MSLKIIDFQGFPRGKIVVFRTVDGEGALGGPGYAWGLLKMTGRSGRSMEMERERWEGRRSMGMERERAGKAG